MQIHESCYPRLAAALSQEELRKEFLVGGLFQSGLANFRYWETDRTILGGMVPAVSALALPNPPEVHSAFFLERREAGVINLGGAGTVIVGDTEHGLEPLDGIYLGRWTRTVSFTSRSAEQPARFYFLSYPAHAAYPVKHIAHKDVTATHLGSAATANTRTLFKYFHPGAFPTCQLVMGFTRLESGSVWNTMPPHTHRRRSEVYCYFHVPANQAVFHFMGEPTSTRHLIVRDLEAVLSPPWSIHSGVGTVAYSFVWGMGGENQEFADMDPAPVAQLQ